MTEHLEVDLDLRLVGYFVAVAEHQHFGRAATALRVAQPSLSRQIRRVEQQLGVRLFDRTPQGTRLTEAGKVFLPRAKALLRSAAQAAAQARAAAEPSRITIGYTTGMIVTPAVREMRREHPDAEVVVSHLDWGQALDALLGHRVDAVVTRLPFPTDGLHVTVLYDEPRALAVPIDHRLAGRDEVTLDDIADEPMPRVRNSDPAWSAYWRIDPRPDGRRAPEGPYIDALEDKFELIASGQAVAIVPEFRGTIRPDITTVRLKGVEPSHVVLATRAGDRTRLVTAFRKLAEAHLTGACRA
ncbi:LysR family transcriptional regulator [Mycobacterium sp. 050134]|uniref:LysR family transcriptional regulator n=1 Tax=Mycobacterium sp. 050134 TaxID=3096111 RepID=UPI002EDA3163